MRLDPIVILALVPPVIKAAIIRARLSLLEVCDGVRLDPSDFLDRSDDRRRGEVAMGPGFSLVSSCSMLVLDKLDESVVNV